MSDEHKSGTLANFASGGALEIKILRQERDRLSAENSLLREFVEEVSLPPYRDTDLASILRTLQTRAKHLLARTQKSPVAPAAKGEE